MASRILPVEQRIAGKGTGKSGYLRCQNRGTAGQILLCFLQMNSSQTPLQKHVGLGALGWVAGVTHIMYGVLTAPPAPRPVPTRWKGTFNLGKWDDHACPTPYVAFLHGRKGGVVTSTVFPSFAVRTEHTGQVEL